MTTNPDPALASVLARYHRAERAGSITLALLAGLIAAFAVVRLPLLAGVAVAAVVLLVVRLPVVRLHSETRLATDASPAAVREAMVSERPPPLVFQWGVADRVETDGPVQYHYSFLFGLRSATLTLDRRETDDGIELTLAADGSAFSTHHVTVADADRDGRTLVTVESDPPRRFGLRRIAAWIAVRRYTPAAFDAMGYDVRDREASVGLGVV